MLHIIHNIGGGEQNLRCQVPQRHMQHHRMVRSKPRHLPDMRFSGDGGEDHQVAGPNHSSALSYTLTRPVVSDCSKYPRTPALLVDRSCTPTSSNDQPVPARKVWM